MSGTNISIEGIQALQKNLGVWQSRKIRELINASNTEIAPKLQSDAKTNRPWTDRTGNARRGLQSYVVTPDDIVIRLIHGVYYGIFLEFRGAGRYSIIRPTIDGNKSHVMNVVRRVME